MDQPAIKLLIVDDNLELCDILKNFFDLTPEIDVCGVSHNGEDALSCIAQMQPDVVLLDLIMPKIDGIAVLEQLHQAKLSHRPKVIVASAIGQAGITATALDLGADYYMIKPYDLYDLSSRIQLVASLYHEPAARGESPETLASRALIKIGIPTHMLGYRYCATAVELLLQEDRPRAIVKEIYGNVADQFETTPACVESAIRKAIRRSWEQNRPALEAMLNPGESGPPANGRFLTNLCTRIRLNMSSPARGNEDGQL